MIEDEYEFLCARATGEYLQDYNARTFVSQGWKNQLFCEFSQSAEIGYFRSKKKGKRRAFGANMMKKLYDIYYTVDELPCLL